MNLAIFGAAGRTGAPLVQQALAAGHEVTAVVRNPAQLSLQHDHLTIRRGDVLDSASLETAVRGQDAVVSCIGGGAAQKPITLYSVGVANILHAMQAGGVRRFMCISANPLEVGNGDVLFDRLVVKPIVRVIFKAPYADLARMEEELRHSDRDWTIVRPPRLIDRPLTGRYRIAYDRNLPRGRSIGRADLAAAMLRLLDDPHAIHSAVTVAY